MAKFINFIVIKSILNFISIYVVSDSVLLSRENFNIDKYKLNSKFNVILNIAEEGTKKETPVGGAAGIREIKSLQSSFHS
jgi:hypothetical protein